MRRKIKTEANTPTDGNPIVASKARMVEVMSDVLEELETPDGRDAPYSLFEMEPARIVGTRLVTYNSDGNKALKPFHRLVVWEQKYPVNTIVGHLTESHLRGMVRAPLLFFCKELAKMQPGTWRAVAARPVDTHKSIWSHVSTGHSASIDVDKAAIRPGQVTGASNHQRTKPRLVKDPHLQIEVVFAELSGSPHIDHENRRTGRVNGKHYRYSQTGLLDDMPETMRAARSQAIAIVNEVFDGDYECVELAESDVREIGHMAEAGLSLVRIAHQFNITEERVEAACKEAADQAIEEALIAEAREKAAGKAKPRRGKGASA